MFLTISTAQSVFKLLGMIVVFVLILGCAYFMTRWLGVSGASQGKNRNIKIIESYRLDQNKCVQILKIGNKYIAIANGKEEVSFLTELEEENLNLEEIEIKPIPNFKEVLSKIKNDQTMNHKNNK